MIFNCVIIWWYVACFISMNCGMNSLIDAVYIQLLVFRYIDDHSIYISGIHKEKLTILIRIKALVNWHIYPGENAIFPAMDVYHRTHTKHKRLCIEQSLSWKHFKYICILQTMSQELYYYWWLVLNYVIANYYTPTFNNI